MHEYIRYEMQYAKKSGFESTARADRRYSDSYCRFFSPFLSFFLSFCLLSSEREKGRKDGEIEK
jgi:hypothetical protein